MQGIIEKTAQCMRITTIAPCKNGSEQLINGDKMPSVEDGLEWLTFCSRFDCLDVDWAVLLLWGVVEWTEDC